MYTCVLTVEIMIAISHGPLNDMQSFVLNSINMLGFISA